MDICFFIPNIGIGGAQRTVVRLANGLNRKGESVRIVTIEAGELISELDNDIEISVLDTLGIPQVNILNCIPSLIKYFHKSPPDVIMSFMKHANIAALLSYKFSAITSPIIISERNHLSTSLDHSSIIKRSIIKFLIKQLYICADGVVSVSEGVAQDLQQTVKIDDDKLYTIYNPVVTPNVKKQSKESVKHPWLINENIDVILGAGRFAKQKDFSTLINAFSIVADERDMVRLIILGEGERREELERQTQCLGIEKIVQFPGQVANPYPYMKLASVFVLSSAWEGLPNVLIESMICGCPVVSTDCRSGPREILNYGQYGSLVPVGDYEKMASSICDTLDNPLPETELNQRAEEFCQQKIVSEYINLFYSIVNEQKAKQ